jgi:hypothetical protein
MQRLSINERPVEIEYDRANHVRTMLAMPGLALEAAVARIAAISRRRRGGIRVPSLRSG